MAIGYLVSLGDQSLDSGDAISASQSTFNIENILGTGQWIWSGIRSDNGNSYSNVTDTGTYYLGTDGNVYFTPDTSFTDSGTASVVSAPSYTDITDGVVDGTSGDDLIAPGFQDAQLDTVDRAAPTSKNDSIDSGDGQDTIIAGDGDDTVRGGAGDDLIFGDGDDSGMFAGTIDNFALSAGNISDSADGTGGPVGQFAVYDNVATTDTGIAVQMRVTVIDVDDPTLVVTLDDTIGLNQDNAVDAGTGVTFRFEFFDQATGEPILIDGALTFRDIDTTAESVSASSSDVTGLALSNDPATSLTATATQDTLSVQSDSSSSGPGDEDHWAQFLFEGQSSMDFTMTSRARFTAYEFGSFDFTNAPLITASDPASMNDLLDGGADNDTIYGGFGDDTILGQGGDDSIVLADGFGNDVITGGETAETLGDTLDMSAVTSTTTVDLTSTNPETGSVSDGTSTAVFSEIENIILGSGTDTIVLADGSGDDVVSSFEAPLDNGDGTFSGRDQLDVTGLSDASGNPVTTEDVTVTQDTSGNAILTFPGGESLTLVGVTPAEVNSVDQLVAMGIPAFAGDFNVAGTAGDDLIDTGYTGDPEGDKVDNTDAQDGSNDDAIFAGDGNDTVLAGLGDDSVRAGAGDDSVSGGDGNDTIFGFEGNDTVDGGLGDDLINTRTSVGTGVPDQAYPAAVPLTSGGLGYDADTDPDNDRDFVIGGDGNDTILTGDDADTISAGAGADQVDAGFDDDFVNGGTGNDTLEGGEGRDTINGADDDDVIYGGLAPTNPDYALSEAYSLADDDPTNPDLAPDNNRDMLFGAAGNDSIYGGDDSDTLYGGTGDDLLDGGIDDDILNGEEGADTLLGGDGDDILTGGIGADSMFGGAGADTIEVAQGDIAEGGDGDDLFVLSELFEAGSAAITITGGEGNETTGDTLRLSDDLSRADITFTNTDDTNGGLSGTFTTSDGSVVTFSEIENIICFTPGTRILTQFGERAIENLKLGDMVVTRDHGLQPIRWMGKRTVRGVGDFAPISIASSVMEGAREGLLVSPQHRLLFTGYRAELLFGESEVLVTAKHLVNGRDVAICPRDEVTYIHIMFDCHEVIYAEGIATESFHPGDTALSAISAPAREELFAIFPELRSSAGRLRETARTCLKRSEAQLLSWDELGDWQSDLALPQIKVNSLRPISKPANCAHRPTPAQHLQTRKTAGG